MERIEFPSTDGFKLAGSLFEAPSPKGTLVIGSATGVLRRYYEPFAEFLGGCGFSTLTFDYRGIGDSRPASLRGFRADLHEWGEKDIDAALSEMERRMPSVPRLYVGHSVGGQIFGLAPGSERISRALFVAGQSGYWGHWPLSSRFAFASLWYLGVPALTAALGYFPMKAGGGEDLPVGVAREWARWCRSPAYVRSYEGFGRARYATLTAAIRDIHIGDDSYAPRVAIEDLLRAYSSAKTELHDVDPRALNAKIGHFGFFRAKFRETLWSDAGNWLSR